ncbi:hypothetical protein OG874_34855 [Nocardia sp. NBC_00565]|nr:hypothetical protein [Nocardia sp. NBC_00565]WUC01885.1 hypothetical protein OG874_34855 [Nocardia sp. NBC_00565]
MLAPGRDPTVYPNMFEQRLLAARTAVTVAVGTYEPTGPVRHGQM